MSERSRELFVELLKSALWGRPFGVERFDVDEVIPWGEILTMAQNHAVLGLLFVAIGELPRDKQPSAESYKRLYGVVARTRQTHALHRAVIAKVVNHLAQGGVEAESVVLLKGEEVAKLYCDPTLRTCGDVDLWVDAENYERALRLLREIGVEPREREAMEKHDTLVVDGVTIELHDHVVGELAQLHQRASFEAWTRGLMRRENFESAEIEGAQLSLLSKGCGVVYLFLHGWQHLESDGLGFRQICDWTLMLNRDMESVDWAEVRTRLQRYGLLRAWYLFEKVGVEWLGLDHAKAPFWSENDMKIPDTLAEKIYVGGNFGFHGSTFSKNADGSFGGKLSSIAKMWRCSMMLWGVDRRYAVEYFLASMRSGFVRLFWREADR
ncbi:MAG: nucleotidyltransferase family protein [Rikenellaceae bacterium]